MTDPIPRTMKDTMFFASIGDMIEHLTRFREEHGEQAICAVLGYPNSSQEHAWKSDPRALSGQLFDFFSACCRLEFADGYHCVTIVACASQDKWEKFAACRLNHRRYPLTSLQYVGNLEQPGKEGRQIPQECVIVGRGDGSDLMRMTFDQLDLWLAEGLAPEVENNTVMDFKTATRSK